MSTTTAPPPAEERGPGGPVDSGRSADRAAAVGDRFEPVGERARYPAPRGHIDPDATKGWVRRVWPVVAAHRILLSASLGGALVALVTMVAVPAVVRQAIDQALVARRHTLGPYVVALVVLAAVRAVAASGYRYGLYKMAYLIEADLRALIYDHLSSLSFSYYDRTQSGQLISRANSDIRAVQMFLGFAPLMSVSLLTFLLAFTFMLSIDVTLTLLGLAALPAVYAVGARLRNRVFPLSWISQARTAELATIVDENIQGVRVVKSFAAEERQVSLLARAAQRLRWSQVQTARARARFGPVMENLPRLGLVAVLVYGGNLVIDDRIQLGTLVAFNAYVLMLQAPFRLLGFFLMLSQRAAASAQRIYEVLDETPEIVDRPGAVVLDDPAGGVVLRDVWFGYGDGPDVLCGLDLDVAPGETLAVVGRTGSGKSTLARLLPRFYDPRRGAVYLDGHDVRDLTVTSVRAAVGVVLDEPFLFSTTVAANIAYGRPAATREEIEAAARAAQAHAFIAALPDGYDTVIGERGYTLSGGQRQRIAIARTLLMAPRVLVLDDATSAIDVHVEEAIHAALSGTAPAAGTAPAVRTTILIAHRLSTIALADRVVLLEGGRVAASGTHAELMAREPRYAEVLARTDDEDQPGEPGRDEPVRDEPVRDEPVRAEDDDRTGADRWR